MSDERRCPGTYQYHHKNRKRHSFDNGWQYFKVYRCNICGNETGNSDEEGEQCDCWQICESGFLGKSWKCNSEHRTLIND